jgi:hypothetical protein
MAKRILIRRDTTINWTNVNPVLSYGELGIEFKTDGTKAIKVGTGNTVWNSLPYLINNPVSSSEFNIHKNDTNAHGSSDLPIANLIAKYNSNAGLQSNKIPAEFNDVLRKIELDAINSNISSIEIDVDNLETDLTNEINTRTLSVSGLQYKVDNLSDESINLSGKLINLSFDIGIVGDNLNTEIGNRESNVSGLQYNIDLTNGYITEEINNRITSVSGAIYTASSDATAKANTAETNAKNYADDLALQTQTWLPAVQTTADLPVNPGNGTYLCRVITGANIGVYQWIGSETTPAWVYFSDNLDFIDRIVNPVTNNIPVITSNGELIDGGQSISGILTTITNGLATKEPAIIAGTINQYWRGDKTWALMPSGGGGGGSGLLIIQKNSVTVGTYNTNTDETINIAIAKNDVGLSNVDNTSDANKPISTAIQTALNGKVNNTALSDYYTKTQTDTNISSAISTEITNRNNAISTLSGNINTYYEPLKYITDDEIDAQTYSEENPTIMVFYPEA